MNNNIKCKEVESIADIYAEIVFYEERIFGYTWQYPLTIIYEMTYREDSGDEITVKYRPGETISADEGPQGIRSVLMNGFRRELNEMAEEEIAGENIFSDFKLNFIVKDCNNDFALTLTSYYKNLEELQASITEFGDF